MYLVRYEDTHLSEWAVHWGITSFVMVYKLSWSGMTETTNPFMVALRSMLTNWVLFQHSPLSRMQAYRHVKMCDLVSQ